MDPLWTDIGQLWVGVFGVGVSLIGFIFVYTQIKQLERTIQSDTLCKLYTQDSEISNALLENSELHPYFYDNKPIEKGSEHYAKVMIMAEMLANYFENILLQEENLKDGVDQYWKSYIGSMFDNSLVLREYVMKQESWYTPKVVEFATAAIKKSNSIKNA